MQVAVEKHRKADQPLQCLETDEHLYYGLSSYESLPPVAALVMNSNQWAGFLRDSAYYCYV